jgi:hypothetical protein
LPILCRPALPISRSRGRHPSAHQHDPASVTRTVATQIIPICVIGAGSDAVGEAVQNGSSARVLTDLYVTQRKVPSRRTYPVRPHRSGIMVSEVPVDARANDAAETARSHLPRCAPYAAEPRVR